MSAVYILMRDSDSDTIREQHYKQTTVSITEFIVLNFRQRF
jgi:hypothetical protein